ncbi:hypothetical protein QQG55_50320 [Brugia pahangi]|uniref:Uncharacterized protein n=1 Tax=Brugia pahangi TaxID=6280 RepID=A0A0N4TNJ4_BRUPA|nr:unnamed protein product [Brugia pahangi]
MSRKQSKKSSREETDETLETSSSFEPFFEAGPEIGSVDPSSSATPSTSSISFISDEPSNPTSTAPSGSTISSAPDESSNISEKVLENLTVPELWAQYVKCLMMAVPSNVGRVDIERTAGIHAEKYLEQILKLSPVASTASGEPLQVPCFNPSDHREISENEKYKVEILKATKADSELIWNTAAQLQALILIRRGKGPAIGLDELRKFNTAMQEAADIYREAIASSQERSVSRVGNFHYRVSYAGRTEAYHVDVMRNLILNQLPPTVRFFTEQTKSEKLKSVLHDLKKKRTRKH